MNNLNTRVEVMAKDIEFLKSEVSEIKQLIKSHTEEERLVWKELLSQKADIWVENAFRYILYTIGGVLILAALSLIVVKVR